MQKDFLYTTCKLHEASKKAKSYMWHASCTSIAKVGVKYKLINGGEQGEYKLLARTTLGLGLC